MKEQYQKIKKYFRNIYAQDTLGYVPHNVIQSWFFATVIGGGVVLILCGFGVYALFFLSDEFIVPDATKSVSTSFSHERLQKIVDYYDNQEIYFTGIRNTLLPSVPETGTLKQAEEEVVEEEQEQELVDEQDAPAPEM